MPDAREGEHTISADQQSSALKHWVSRFADPIVLVAFIAAIASASFAYQTNRISQRQVELLNRQVAIEESLALPVFSVTMDVDDMPGTGASSHWIRIGNSGGLANDLSIDVLPYLSYWWLDADAGGEPVMTQGEEVPLVGYFDEYTHVLPSRMHPGAETTLGFDGNATSLRDITGQLTGQLSARDSVTELDHALEIMVSLSYIDYTGTERADYYVAHVSSSGEVFPPQQFIRVNAALGEDIWTDYYEKFDSQFVLMLDPGADKPDADHIQVIGARIYDQRYVDVVDTATPAARISSDARGRSMRQAAAASS